MRACEESPRAPACTAAAAPRADAFKALDWARIHASMSQPAFLFDGRNILDHKALRAIGFEVYAVGHPLVGGH